MMTLEQMAEQLRQKAGDDGRAHWNKGMGIPRGHASKEACAEVLRIAGLCRGLLGNRDIAAEVGMTANWAAQTVFRARSGKLTDAVAATYRLAVERAMAKRLQGIA